MDSKNFTLQAQNVIQQAFMIAEDYKHRTVETGHLLKALLAADKDPLVRGLMGQLGVNSEDIDYQIDNQIIAYPKTQGEQLYLSLDANKALNLAMAFALEIKDEIVSSEHMLVGIASNEDSSAELLRDSNVILEKLKALIRKLRTGIQQPITSEVITEDTFMAYTTNLNLEAVHGRLNPVVGREEEINLMMQILSRRIKNNVLLIGDQGVGKTSIVEGLAAWIAQEKVPDDFSSKQIISLNMDRINPGFDQGEDIQQKLQQVLQRLKEDKDSMLLFIDELFDLMDAEKKNPPDAENILRAFILSDAIQVIATTTLDQYYRFNDRDKPWVHRFQPLMVNEPEVNDAVTMLRGVKQGFENFHKVFIPDETIQSAVEWSARFITDRFLPEKAVELIDEAASRVHLEMVSLPLEISELDKKIASLEVERKILLEGNEAFREGEIAKTIQKLNEKVFNLKARFHLERSIQEDMQRLRQQLGRLRTRADQARKRKNYDLAADIHLTKIKETEHKLAMLHNKLTGMQQDSPMINVNVTPAILADIISKKTGISLETILRDEKEMLMHLEEELQKKVFGQPEAIKTIAEVIRRRKAGLQDLNKPVASLLFAGGTGSGRTEMAKALSSLLGGNEKLLVQIRMEVYKDSQSNSRLIGSLGDETSSAERGSLLDAVRKNPYAMVMFRSIEKAHPDVITFLIQLLTLGYAVDPQGRKISFKNTVMIMTTELGKDVIFKKMSRPEGSERNLHYAETSEMVYEIVKKNLPAALMDLIEEFILFTPLSRNAMFHIIQSQLKGVRENLARQHVILEIHDRAMDWFATKGTEHRDGIRSLKKLIQKHLLNKLSEEILSGRIDKKKKILIDLEKDGISIRNN